MPRPINEQLRQARSEEILEAARAQLAAEGLAGFSLRAVARRLELAPNAIYNYYPSLDDLITALLLAAFSRFAQALQAADKPDAADSAGRFAAVCAAYRSWAVANPIDYDLIFGRPIPGYQAPDALLGPVAGQGFAIALKILIDAWQAGQLSVPERYQAIPPGIAGFLAERGKAAEAGLPLALHYLMLTAWARLHGMVTLEIHGSGAHAIGDMAAFYQHGVACLIAEIGLAQLPGGP